MAVPPVIRTWQETIGMTLLPEISFQDLKVTLSENHAEMQRSGPGTASRPSSASLESSASPEYRSAPPTYYAPDRDDMRPELATVQGQQRRQFSCWDHGCNGRPFSTKSNLVRHRREKSDGGKRFTCVKCGAVFSRSSARNLHAEVSCGEPHRPSLIR